MQMSDRQPPRINLEPYIQAGGLGNDILKPNNAVMDRFMAVSDMRAGVEVRKKADKRTIEYEDVGFVRVAKQSRMPKFRIPIFGLLDRDDISEIH